jgi:hypothetical protein
MHRMWGGTNPDEVTGLRGLLTTLRPEDAFTHRHKRHAWIQPRKSSSSMLRAFFVLQVRSPWRLIRRAATGTS